MLDTATLTTFRTEVAAWFAEHTPPDWQARLDVLDDDAAHEFHLDWLRSLNASGYAAPAVPRQWGGGGYSPREQTVIYEEWARADAPGMDRFVVSLHHVPATLMLAGTPDQQSRYLADAMAGTVWCQGFSEPGAGSDLAALRTRAERVDGGWEITGQKIWTSHAELARYCLLLARTDPDSSRTRGITYFILDMQQPGVVVRPIRQITGHPEFCELFLERAFVSDTDVLGEVGQGWTVAQTTLATERGPVGFDVIARIGTGLEQARELVADDPAGRAELGRLSARYHQVRSLAFDLVDGAEHGLDTGGAASLLKVAFTEVLADFTEFAGRTHGIAALTDPGRRHFHGFVTGDWTSDWIAHWGWTIAAGTNEVQRTMIAERQLGLPRDKPRPGAPSPDRAPVFAHPGLGAEGRELARVAARVLATSPEDDRAGADLEWFGIGLPEELGGSGGGLADLAPLLQAAGATGASTSLGWNAGLVTPLLLADGGAEATELARSIGDGRRTVGVQASGLRAAGELLVFGPRDPDLVLIRPADGGETLALVEAGDCELRPVAGLDPSRGLFRVMRPGVTPRVRLTRAPDGAGERGAGLFDWTATRIGLLAALDAVGAAASGLLATLDYAAAREQFGRPIGSFQAYQHRCASAFIGYRLAQSAAYRAAAEDDPALARAVASAGIADCVRACGDAIQLHGAIGYSWETGLHHHLRRARADQLIAAGSLGGAAAAHLGAAAAGPLGGGAAGHLNGAGG